jgi:fructose-bisphosphate aldolase class II
MTPADYYEEIVKAAHEIGHDVYVVHADHISIKKGDEEDLRRTRELIGHQVDSGYTSFAIDASHLFDLKGQDLKEELRENIRCTTEMACFIKERMGRKRFGLEVEVGEIGKTDASGRVLTSPEEAVTFLTSLKANGIDPNLLAIANGSAHGNTFDENGKLLPQVSIDLVRTRDVISAIKASGLKVGIAQHGITGTPRDLIAQHFPKGDILKGNVGTHWQNIFFDTVKVFEPDLYRDMQEWTVSTYSAKEQGKTPDLVFGKHCKNVFKPFKDRAQRIGKDTEEALEAMAYAEALVYFKAFSSSGTAKYVRETLAKE